MWAFAMGALPCVDRYARALYETRSEARSAALYHRARGRGGRLVRVTFRGKR